MKNTAAHTAVERDRKFALPVAPNRLPDAPLPKEAPMSAPLPCWIRTRPIITSAATICSTTTKLSIQFIPAPSESRGSAAGAADGGKVRHLEGRAAEQAAVDVLLGKQSGGVIGLDAAAIQQLHLRGLLCRRMQLRAPQRVNGLRLFGRCRLAGADGPHRLVGDHHLR